MGVVVKMGVAACVLHFTIGSRYPTGLGQHAYTVIHFVCYNNAGAADMICAVYYSNLLFL